jgi:hypothetical protein
MRSVRHGCGRSALGVAGLIDIASSSETPVVIWSRNRQYEGQRLLAGAEQFVSDSPRG